MSTLSRALVVESTRLMQQQGKGEKLVGSIRQSSSPLKQFDDLVELLLSFALGGVNFYHELSELTHLLQ